MNYPSTVALTLFCVSGLLLPHAVAEPPTPPSKTDSPPNVILILADDMALGDLSSLNGGLSRTPHLDRLKDDSVWFSQAYSAAPVCAPARAALLTGRYPHRTGVVTLNQLTYPSLTRLRRDETTIAELLQDRGYATGLIGKWHCGNGQGYEPNDHGFDEFEGFLNHTFIRRYFDYRLQVAGRTVEVNDQYLTSDLSARAVDFVRRHRDEPFFLHLAHYAPHRPIDAPAERIEPYLRRGLDQQTATVYAMIEIMDQGIGELLEELDRLQIREQTIVVFASDNGPDPLVQRRFNHDLRETKYTVYEGGVKVPFLVHWPNKLTPKELHDTVHFTDVLPTLMELCGFDVPETLELDGASLAGRLTGNADVAPLPGQRFWQWNRAQPRYSHNAAVREGNWKLVRPFVTRNIPKNDSELPPALYDLSSDPSESHDVAAEHPERVTQMNQALESWTRAVERDRTRTESVAD
ncbi:Arylsulfatase precursor [Stieleria maiorica]|uniref:Arylsulfatase n=1 Tax=Stieleria maiorica TaxID=2795974 RepID=A0A5B9MNJ6_9BACT|nr:arylsulfatase [Stieleria maiorica]QEG00438.1 Arylsulfatase precursor [Stieleria maiorica]